MIREVFLICPVTHCSWAYEELDELATETLGQQTRCPLEHRPASAVTLLMAFGTIKPLQREQMKNMNNVWQVGITLWPLTS